MPETPPTCQCCSLCVYMWPSGRSWCKPACALTCVPLPAVQEYKRKQIEEQRQAERLQRQLQQEHAYLVSLQQQQQEKKPQLYHYNKNLEPNNKPSWAREVVAWPSCGNAAAPLRSRRLIRLCPTLSTRWRSAASSTGRARPRSAQPCPTLPSSRAPTPSASPGWSSLPRRRRCRGPWSPRGGRGRWAQIRKEADEHGCSELFSCCCFSLCGVCSLLFLLCPTNFYCFGLKHNPAFFLSTTPPPPHHHPLASPHCLAPSSPPPPPPLGCFLLLVCGRCPAVPDGSLSSTEALRRSRAPLPVTVRPAH